MEAKIKCKDEYPFIIYLLNELELFRKYERMEFY